MHRVAVGIEDRLHIPVDRLVVVPDIGLGQRDVLGKRTLPIDPDALGVLAEMAATGQAVAAVPADHVTLATDHVAFVEVLDVGAHLDNRSDKLVADNHRHRDRLPSPLVPLVDVQVGATDPGPFDPDQHVVNPVLGNRYLLEPQARLRPRLDQRLHEKRPDAKLTTRFDA